MLRIKNDGLSGTASAGSIKELGLIKASMSDVEVEKATRRIRNYSGVEMKGKELFNQLGIEYMKEERRTWK
jgi:hypothetical protein